MLPSATEIVIARKGRTGSLVVLNGIQEVRGSNPVGSTSLTERGGFCATRHVARSSAARTFSTPSLRIDDESCLRVWFVHGQDDYH